jgi:flagellin
MSNVTTTPSTLAALIVLRGVNKDLDTVNSQVTSGQRVASASDDPTYWSMATTMRSDKDSLSTIGDALNLGASKVDTASTAMDSVVQIVTQIQSKLVSANEPGADKNSINADIQQLKAELQSTTQSASFSGENWLYNTSTTPDMQRSVISNFTRGPGGSISLETINYDSSKALLIDTVDPSRGLLTRTVDANAIASDGTSTPRNYYLLGADGGTAPAGASEISLSDSTTGAQLTDMINATNAILQSVTSADSTLGLMKARIDSQSDFVSKLSDDLDNSVTSLVGTNMEEASARQAALQTAQQMGIQSLSIANTMASKVLILLQSS